MSDPATGVGILAAIAAGVVSFLSPCVLPLVPGYLGAVVGVNPRELDRAGARRVLGPSLLFVATFSAIFILTGLTATAIGSTLTDNRPLLERISAVIIIALGLFYLASALAPRLGVEWHSDWLIERAGRGGPILAGAAFAVAWTPCVGPTLGAILSVAGASGSEWRGAVLLAFYSAGLAIPFLVTSLAFERTTGVLAVVKRHYGVVVCVGGCVLIAMGVLIWTNEYAVLNVQAQDALSHLGLGNFAI